MNIPDRKDNKYIFVAVGSRRGFRASVKRIYLAAVKILFPPLAHYHTGRYAGKKHHLILDTFLSLLMFAAAFYAWQNWSDLKNIFTEDVKVSWQAAENLVGGKESEFAVTVVNKNGQALKNIRLMLDLGGNLKLTGGGITEFIMDELAPGKEQKFIIKAVPLGLIGDKLVLKGLLTYVSPSGEKKESIIKTEYTLFANDFAIGWDLPNTISTGKTAESKIRLNGTVNLVSGYARIIKPDSLVILSSDPRAVNGKWEISDAKNNAEISVRYYFNDTANETENIILEYADNASGITLAREEFSIKTVKPQISLALTADPAALSAGASSQIILTYKNTGAENISDSQITCSVSSETPAGLKIAESGGTADSGNIVFNAQNSEALSLLPADQEGKIYFTAKAPANLTNRGTAGITCGLSGMKKDQDGNLIEISSNPSELFLTLSPAVRVKAYGMYTDYGAGPLPPKVGFATIYRIFFEITDPGKFSANLEVSAQIPNGVDYNGNAVTSANDAPRYNSGSRTVAWNISEYPKNEDKIMASFEVKVIPNKNHIGYPLELLAAGSFSYGINGENGTTSSNFDHITTVLKSDPAAAGKDLVQQ